MFQKEFNPVFDSRFLKMQRQPCQITHFRESLLPFSGCLLNLDINLFQIVVSL